MIPPLYKWMVDLEDLAEQCSTHGCLLEKIIHVCVWS